MVDFFGDEIGVCVRVMGEEIYFLYGGVSPSVFVLTPEQKHSSCVLIYPYEWNGSIGCDGILTLRSEGIKVGVRTADCLPIIFVSKNMKGAIHAGWRGIAAGIVENAIKKLEIAGEKRENTFAVIGPHICGRCYEVGEDVWEIFSQLCSQKEIESLNVLSEHGGKKFLNMSAYVISLMREMGIRIFHTNICVFENRNFFSRRRGDTGNQISYV